MSQQIFDFSEISKNNSKINSNYLSILVNKNNFNFNQIKNLFK